MKKINWGTRIALLYIGFVAGILTLVTMSMNQRVDLVTEDYYAQELAFQKKIEKINRAKTLPTPLRWQVLDGALEVQYPTELTGQDLAGSIHFYCPSDNKKDAEFSVHPGSANKQTVLLQSVQPGRYLLQFDWKNGETAYWNEGVVVVK
ncbi:FixH family protein [Salmonirosea aquatica]|uniref:Nitrogen fixation protein FixH n=1 Tax=Salmonirosea aquatica TaxID=2654236 RepID=A0A7C9BDQ9_9BACT|nr:hypothetical protein [Cytophagaceae bacterium SJW1-29]